MKIESLNCPNCGAPVSKTDVCEYCGTRFREEEEMKTLYVDNRPIIRFTNDAIEIIAAKRTGGIKE